MRIVQIGLYPENDFIIKGGIESSVYGLTQELIKENQVWVIVPPGKNIHKDEVRYSQNLKVYFFSSLNSSLLSRFLKVKRIINEFKPDICHLHTTTPLNLFILIYLKICTIPSLTTIHGLSFIEYKNLYLKTRTIKNLLKFLIYSICEFITIDLEKNIIVDTEYVNNKIKELRRKKKIFRLPSIFVIPQGVNKDFYTIPDLNEKDNILSVGTIYPRKGHYYSIKAVEKLIPEFPDIKFTIIGTVADAEYSKTINQYIYSHKLTANIIILNDVTFENLKEYYSFCSLFILHSQEESQGIVLAEALACGKPIVATSVGGIPDLIEEGICGHLTDYQDVDTFSDKIKSILSNNDLRTKFSENARIKGAKYSWLNISMSIISLYKNLID